jgi:hypothetical protein
MHLHNYTLCSRNNPRQTIETAEPIRYVHGVNNKYATQKGDEVQKTQLLGLYLYL